MVDIYSFLQQHRIEFQRIDHKAVFTCEEAEGVIPDDVPGADTKNLFLRDDKGRRHFIVSVGHEKKVNLKALGEMLGVKSLGFASAERLKKYLGVEPGSVTLLGAVNDPEHAVEVIIDEDIWKADALRVHPLVNTATLVIPREGMEKFFGATGHAVKTLSVPS